MIMAPTSRDEIERSVVTQEPTPSILAIGQSIIVTTRIGCVLDPHTKASAAPKACGLRLLKRKSATTSCLDPNLARGLTRPVSDPYFSNSRGRALVSERHRKPFGGLTPLHHVPSATGKTIRPLHAIRCPVAQSEGRPRAHWTRRRPCAE